MKSIKYITLGLATTLSVFFAVLYSSCSKDQCGGIVCQNKGTCNGGRCICIIGSYGDNCETVYRDDYIGTYKGVPPDDPYSDTTNSLVFSPSSDTSNLNKMQVAWVDTSGFGRASVPIELKNNSASGSGFDITETPSGSIIYTGSGSISKSVASMQLVITDTASGYVKTVFFNSYVHF